MDDNGILHVSAEGDKAAPVSESVSPTTPAPPAEASTPPAETPAPPAAAAAPPPTDEPPSTVPPPGRNEPEDYSTINIGDVIGGLVVADILLQYEKAIVFTTPKGGIYFWENLDGAANTALAEFYRVTSRSTAQLNAAYRHEINGLIGAALAEALNLSEGADLKKPFKAVDDFIDSKGPIDTVFGSSNDWVVFIDKNGRLLCDYPSPPDSTAPLLTEFHRLQQLAVASLRKLDVTALAPILGTELTLGLQRTTPVQPSEAFVASKDFIELKHAARMRGRYLSASLIAAVLAGVAASFLLVRVVQDTDLLLGCIGGIIGATISVLQRSADMEIRRFLPTGQVIMQGSIRIVLGVLFGVIIVAAARSDFALGAFVGNGNALFIVGVAAGFSERLVPDLLTKIAADKKLSAADGAAAQGTSNQ